MGEVVGAALLAHVPTIVLPEKDRRELNNGVDTTLVAGLRELRRDVFEVLDYDTVVVLDSHWATTVEFVVTAQERRAGLFTSEELPRGMVRRPYDFPGDPELAHAIAAQVLPQVGGGVEDRQVRVIDRGDPGTVLIRLGRDGPGQLGVAGEVIRPARHPARQFLGGEQAGPPLLGGHDELHGGRPMGVQDHDRVVVEDLEHVPA